MPGVDEIESRRGRGLDADAAPHVENIHKLGRPITPSFWSEADIETGRSRAQASRPAETCMVGVNQVGDDERILVAAIAEQFTLTAGGEFEPRSRDQPSRSPRPGGMPASSRSGGMLANCPDKCLLPEVENICSRRLSFGSVKYEPAPYIYGF
jgi:hypothetical protein